MIKKQFFSPGNKTQFLSLENMAWRINQAIFFAGLGPNWVTVGRSVKEKLKAAVNSSDIFACRPETRVVRGANGYMNSAWKIFGVAPRSLPNSTTATNIAAPTNASRKYQRTSLWWLLCGRPEFLHIYLTAVSVVQCWSLECLYLPLPGSTNCYVRRVPVGPVESRNSWKIKTFRHVEVLKFDVGPAKVLILVNVALKN